MCGFTEEKNLIDKKIYKELLEKVSLPMPLFLSHVLSKYPEYGKKAWYDFYLKNRAKKMGKVLSLHCELTSRCNLDCKMCYVHSAKMKKSELSTKQWMDILEQAIEEGIYSVCLSGGEAMLHPGFWELYEYLHKNGVRVSVFTNGLCLTDEVIKRFQKMPPNIIQVSLYGINEDGYRRVTGSMVFVKVEQALQKLKKAELSFQVAVTPSRFLYSDIEGVLQFLEEHNYPYRVNKALFMPHEETGRSMEDIELTKEELANIWKLLQEKRRENGIKNRMIIPQYTDDLSKGISCASGVTAAYINYEGIMNGCVAMPLVNADVCTLGFKEAWHQVNKKSLEYQMPKECMNCEKYSVCMYCPAEHFQSVGEGKCCTAICERTEYYFERQIIPQNKCNE